MDVKLLFLLYILRCTNSHSFKNRNDVIKEVEEKLSEVEADLERTINDLKAKGVQENGKKGKKHEGHSLWRWNEGHKNEKHKYYEGDIVFHDIPGPPKGDKDHKKEVQFDLIDDTSSHWDSYYTGNDGKRYVEIPYIYGDTATTNIESAFNEAIADYEANTCIRFVKRTNQDSYLKVINDTGCWSYIGKQQEQPQEISLEDPGCDYKSTAVHEIMHALGYFHEQSRPDRDKYVKINYENININMTFNFNKMNSITQGTDYDYKSVMHYGEYAFSKNGEPTIERVNALEEERYELGNEEGLSEIDIKSLNLIYCQDNNPTDQPEVTTTEQPGQEITTTKEPGPEPTEPVHRCPEFDRKLCKFVRKSRQLCRHCAINRACSRVCRDRDLKDACEIWAWDGECHSKKWSMARRCATTCRHAYCGEEGELEGWEELEWLKKRDIMAKRPRPQKTKLVDDDDDDDY